VRRRSCLQTGTALAAAAQFKDPTSLQILLSHGAEMDPLALFDAIKVRGHKNGTATMAVLIDHGADVNYMTKNWTTPLLHSVHYRSKEKVLYLLKHGADPTLRGRVGKDTPAECAQRRGDQELFEILKAAEVEHAQ
jgi:ankyrin